MTEKDLTASDLADRYDVEKRTVLGWLERGTFPNARKIKSPFGTDFWIVPERDLDGFQPQRRRGRPALQNPTKVTLAKRRQRERESSRID